MATQFKNFAQFQSRLVNDPQLQDEFKANPVKAVEQFQQKSVLSTDKWVYRIVVLMLGATVLGIVIAVSILIGSDSIEGDDDVPTILTSLGSGAIGALAGLLVSPPSTDS